MDAKDLTHHACQQVLRFTQAANWNDLTEERKVQLGFNMGIVALGLGLSKEDGYTALSQARQGQITMQNLHKHLLKLINAHGIAADKDHLALPF